MHIQPVVASALFCRIPGIILTKFYHKSTKNDKVYWNLATFQKRTVQCSCNNECMVIILYLKGYPIYVSKNMQAISQNQHEY